MTWNELYQQYFQQHFGKPFDVQVYHDKDGFALKLATHDWAAPGFRVYASIGLADKLARNEEEHFGEVILSTDSADPEVPMLFVNALFFILHHDIPFGSRFSIGGIEELQPTFFQRYRKSALYFTRTDQKEEEPADLIRNGDLIGRVYEAYFITSEEDAFLDDYGAEAFEKEFRELGTERNRLRRAPAI